MATAWIKHKEHPRNVQRSDDEMMRLHPALDAHPSQQSANAVRLLLLTGSRRTEVLGAKWGEINLDTGVWLKPATRTKQREASSIPLRDEALTLLRKLRKEVAPGEYPFPGATGDKPLRDIKKFWRSICKTADLKNFHLHDLRHCFARRTLNAGATREIVKELLRRTDSTSALFPQGERPETMIRR